MQQHICRKEQRFISFGYGLIQQVSFHSGFVSENNPVELKEEKYDKAKQIADMKDSQLPKEKPQKLHS